LVLRYGDVLIGREEKDMRMRGRVIGKKKIILPLFVFILMASTAKATMVSQNLDIAALTTHASKVVEAKCVTVSEDPNSPNLIYTFKVSRMLKGRKRTSEVKVRVPGGHLGQYNLYVPGVTSAAPRVGDRMLLFLGSYSKGYFPIGYWKGMKRIAKDQQGREIVEVEKGKRSLLSEVRSRILRAVREANEP
jgi:hypothetical protein